MIMKLRRKKTNPSSNFFEWQPQDSGNGKWYTVNYDDIGFTSSPFGEEKARLIRNLFNAMLAGLVAYCEGRYLRDERKLILDLESEETAQINHVLRKEVKTNG